MVLPEAEARTVARKLGARRRIAIDLDHLRRQTMGDEVLQRQVLGLFSRQSRDQIKRLKAATSLRERCEAAHALVGAANGVGAFSVATIAREIELSQGPVEGRLKALDRAVQSARDFIADFLAE